MFGQWKNLDWVGGDDLRRRGGGGPLRVGRHTRGGVRPGKPMEVRPRRPVWRGLPLGNKNGAARNKTKVRAHPSKQTDAHHKKNPNARSHGCTKEGPQGAGEKPPQTDKKGKPHRTVGTGRGQPSEKNNPGGRHTQRQTFENTKIFKLKNRQERCGGICRLWSK